MSNELTQEEILDTKFREILDWIAQKETEQASTEDLEEAYFLTNLKELEDSTEGEILARLRLAGKSLSDFN